MVSHKLHRAQIVIPVSSIRLSSTLPSAFYLRFQVFSQKVFEIVDKVKLNKFVV